MPATTAALAKPRLPAAERRNAILDAALPLFARDGYAGTSINEIVAATDVTKPVVYDHFASKRDLYVALLRREGEAMFATLAGALVADRPLDARLRAIAERLVRFVRAHPDAARLLLRTPGGDVTTVAVHRELRGTLAQAVTAAILADPAFAASPGLSRRASAQLHAELQAAIFERLGTYALDHPRAPARAIANLVTSFLWNGLGH
jgi:AcrR family transcriptional regulator